MTNEQKEAFTVIDYICDKCGDGEYLPTGDMRFSSPATDDIFYLHECSSCADSKNFTKTYPSKA